MYMYSRNIITRFVYNVSENNRFFFLLFFSAFHRKTFLVMKVMTRYVMYM